jgi:drug/metabolite transporter (DMT)-like permease
VPRPETRQSYGMGDPGRTIPLREIVIANFGLTVMVLCWGAFFPLLDRLLQTWDFYSVTLARQILGALVLFVGVLAERHRAPLPPIAPWRRILFLGFVGVTISSLLTSLGVMASSGLSSAIISTTNPVSSTLTAAVLYGDRPAAGMVFGTILSVVGGLVSVFGDAPIYRAEFHGGEILIVLANITWTWMSMTAQRWLHDYTQLQITAFTVAAGAFCLLLFLPIAVASGVALRVDFGAESLWMMCFAGILPIALGNFCWHYGVSRIGVVAASMYNNLLPIAAVAITVSLGGSFSWLQVLGAAIILAGVFTAQLLALRRNR